MDLRDCGIVERGPSRSLADAFNQKVACKEAAVEQELSYDSNTPPNASIEREIIDDVKGFEDIADMRREFGRLGAGGSRVIGPAHAAHQPFLASPDSSRQRPLGNGRRNGPRPPRR